MPYGYNPAAKQDPMRRLSGALEPPAKEAPVTAAMTIPNPVTRKRLSPNKHAGRTYAGKPVGIPRWIVIHTQEGGRTAWDLAGYLAQASSQVSYNAVVDDTETVLCVPWHDTPWSAANANPVGLHLCMAGTYTRWSRGKWLETSAADGKNEDLELTNTARLVAWLCQQYQIPPDYIGGRGVR